MKQYTMLKTVQGSRDGIKVETFTKGKTYELDATLAEQFYHQGAVEEAGGAGTAPSLREGARNRSAKVTGPAETKVTGPAEAKEGEAGVDPDTQNVEELVALARDTYGLDVDTTLDAATLRAMIREAAGEEDESEDEDGSKKKAKKGKK